MANDNGTTDLLKLCRLVSAVIIYVVIFSPNTHRSRCALVTSILFFIWVYEKEKYPSRAHLSLSFAIPLTLFNVHSHHFISPYKLYLHFMLQRNSLPCHFIHCVVTTDETKQRVFNGNTSQCDYANIFWSEARKKIGTKKKRWWRFRANRTGDGNPLDLIIQVTWISLRLIGDGEVPTLKLNRRYIFGEEWTGRHVDLITFVVRHKMFWRNLRDDKIPIWARVVTSLHTIYSNLTVENPNELLMPSSSQDLTLSMSMSLACDQLYQRCRQHCVGCGGSGVDEDKKNEKYTAIHKHNNEMVENGHREAAATSISTLFAVFFRSFIRLRVDSVGVWNKCGKVFTSIIHLKSDHFNFVPSMYPEFRRYFSSLRLNTAFFSWDRSQHFNRVPNLYI